jgi:hypothetical protein
MARNPLFMSYALCYLARFGRNVRCRLLEKLLALPGRPVPGFDCLFAAGALHHALRLVRRNQKTSTIRDRMSSIRGASFAEANRIRKELLEAGIVLEDTPQGKRWRRA